MLGELHPLGGGDSIPLLKPTLLVGRRESCDIVLRFANVSAHHCELSMVGGYWYIKDVGSKNGVKVNGLRVVEKRLDPGDELAIARHKYEISYSPNECGALGPPPVEDLPSDILSKPLLERAGLARMERPASGGAGSPAKNPSGADKPLPQVRDRNRPT